MKTNAVLIDPRDNVATVTEEVAAGASVAWPGGGLRASESVPFGHKVAISAIAPGEVVRKYGHPIGRAAGAIEPGEWVHTHNLAKDESS